MDLTNFSLTSESLPIIREFAEHLPGGFVIYQENQNRDIIFVNRSMLSIFKCRDLEEFREHTGYTFPGMVHPDDFERVQHSIDAQIEGEHGKHDHVEYRITTRDGEIRWLDDYGHFSHSEDYGDLYYVFLIDITEAHVAREAKNNFFFNMSHELLTPMNAVSSFIKLAQKHRDDPERLENYLNRAIEATDNMVRLIDDLVEINRAKDLDDIFREHSEKGVNISPPNNCRILIAEDNEINQLLLKTILTESGFEVEITDDGVPAVEAVASHSPGYYDAVLMDIRMKRMDGFEATRLIRRIPGADAKALPVIALSANSREEDIRHSLESGMNIHLAKPYDPEQIIETIKHFLQNKKT